MPVLTPTVDVYHKASDLPPYVWDTLEECAAEANCVLPLALKACEDEKNPHICSSDFWILCHYPHSSTVDFILSATHNELGEYPIFIVPLCDLEDLQTGFVNSRMEAMVAKLREVTPVERVYSVFAPYAIANAFTNYWTRMTTVMREPEAYYDAQLSICNRKTFRKRQNTISEDIRHSSRPATESDIPRIAELCYEFSQDSDPFFLTPEDARLEAVSLVRNQQVWVQEVSLKGSRPCITCIAAFTRNSSTHATITKVFTDTNSRGQKSAQRLVRRVCEYLFSQGKDTVSLYVGRKKDAAVKVYHNVGFAGLTPGAMDDSKRWLEIGFDQKKVDLGHW
ncbi:hypothetical protein VNI00_011700 [Paramarasmius palmivorus]|uniref:N-acetyltransferase domain-containing protein n=1 Tax=Paramarasmius palmivorus TaxID=297713 RepID=A0AAW0CEF0_9AGAR